MHYCKGNVWKFALNANLTSSKNLLQNGGFIMIYRGFWVSKKSPTKQLQVIRPKISASRFDFRPIFFVPINDPCSTPRTITVAVSRFSRFFHLNVQLSTGPLHLDPVKQVGCFTLFHHLFSMVVSGSPKRW